MSMYCQCNEGKTDLKVTFSKTHIRWLIMFVFFNIFLKLNF